MGRHAFRPISRQSNTSIADGVNRCQTHVVILLAVYRHIDKNIKAGVGYNFTTYSDDLTDLSYRSRGWFMNVLATY